MFSNKRITIYAHFALTAEKMNCLVAGKVNAFLSADF